MWVIKLGGSFYDSPDLNDWLKTIVQFGSGKVVVVPGGGPFAEKVRQAQEQHEFNDHIAHHMALSAMDQFGLFLIGIAQSNGLELVAARSQQEIEQVISEQRLPIWLPSHHLSTNSDIPQNWQVTSDSLAGYLALQLKAQQLVLIKHCKSMIEDTRFEVLELEGIIDNNLKNYARGAEYTTSYLGGDQTGVLQAMLETGNHAATYIS